MLKGVSLDTALGSIYIKHIKPEYENLDHKKFTTIHLFIVKATTSKVFVHSLL